MKKYIILPLLFFVLLINFKTLNSQNVTECYFNRFYSIYFYDNQEYKITIGGIGQTGCDYTDILSFGTYKKEPFHYYLTSSSTINPDSIDIQFYEKEDRSLMDSFKICIDHHMKLRLVQKTQILKEKEFTYIPLLLFSLKIKSQLIQLFILQKSPFLQE